MLGLSRCLIAPKQRHCGGKSLSAFSEAGVEALRLVERRASEAARDGLRHVPNASAAAMAAMLMMPRLVTVGTRMWTGFVVPIRIGPTASALLSSVSSVIEMFDASKLGKMSKLASSGKPFLKHSARVARR